MNSRHWASLKEAVSFQRHTFWAHNYSLHVESYSNAHLSS